MEFSKTRTSATIPTIKLGIFKTVARIKYNNDPMNTAWEEAVDLFLKANKTQLKKLDIEIGDILKKSKE